MNKHSKVSNSSTSLNLLVNGVHPYNINNLRYIKNVIVSVLFFNRVCYIKLKDEFCGTLIFFLAMVPTLDDPIELTCVNLICYCSICLKNPEGYDSF